MKISAHQPAYLPWMGYFDKIAKSDLFVYLDNVQFEKNSFTNRNLIKTAQGACWLTLPVRQKGHMSSTLLTLPLDDSQPWRRKHLQSIALNYRKAPGFDEKFSRLERQYQTPAITLADFCWNQLQFWLAELDLACTLIRASTLPDMGRKSDLVFNLCRHFAADTYLSGKLGKDYLAESVFAEHKVHIEYQDYQPPVYPQLYGQFIPALSILDLWMNSPAPLSGYFK